MKSYAGLRTIDGLKVTVDGEPLDNRSDVRTFDVAGFEWGYVGDAPKQLAFALLCDHLGDDEKAAALTDSFMRRVVAILDNEWQLTSAEITDALNKDQEN